MAVILALGLTLGLALGLTLGLTLGLALVLTLERLERRNNFLILVLQFRSDFSL